MKSFFVALFAFVILDYLWLGYVMKDFNLNQLAQIGRIADGNFQVWFAPAIFTYLLMAFAITQFVLPAAKNKSWRGKFLTGALMGLIIYGVYDTTNLAILKDYPLAFAIPDIAWGTFVFGAVTVIVFKVNGRAGGI